jgi:hypothetical protein
MSADQIADLIKRVEQIERHLGIRTEPQQLGGSKQSPTVATFERDETPGVSPVGRVRKEKT